METQSEIINTIDNDNDAELLKVMQAKRTIASALNRKNLVEILREIVDTSECLEFSSKRSRKFISPTRPELLLVLIPEAVERLYPTQFSELSTKDVTLQHNIRESIVKAEISDSIVDFFTAVFMFIKTGEVPTHYEAQKDRVMKITDGTDVVTLRDSINNLFNKTNKDGTVSEELGFIFSVITAISFPADDEIFNDNSVFVEIVY